MKKKEVQEKIAKMDIAGIPFLTNQCYFDILVDYYTKAEISVATIMSVKKYINIFGLQIMMVFKNFYFKMSAQDLVQYEDTLEYISDYVYEFFGAFYFPELHFYNVKKLKHNIKP